MRKKHVLVAGGTAIAVTGGTWAVHDYRSWRRLGVGGLPPNPVGWLVTTALRLRGRDPFRVRRPDATPANAAMIDVPARRGARPRVSRHPIPHRVLYQHPPQSLREAVQNLFDEFAESSSPALEYRTSRWERHNQALCLRTADYPHPVSRAAGGEIAHLHPSDASMHLILHPADAQRIIDLGWGELHPLAGVTMGLPATYTLLYPPQTADDIGPIRTILAAAVTYMTGESANLDGGV